MASFLGNELADEILEKKLFTGTRAQDLCEDWDLPPYAEVLVLYADRRANMDVVPYTAKYDRRPWSDFVASAKGMSFEDRPIVYTVDPVLGRLTAVMLKFEERPCEVRSAPLPCQRVEHADPHILRFIPHSRARSSERTRKLAVKIIQFVSCSSSRASMRRATR
jgi:hypothetical protein